MLESVVSFVHDVSSYLVANSEQNLDDVVTKSTGMVSFTHHSWPSCYHSSISCHKFCTQTPQSTSSDPGKGSCQLTLEMPACMITEPVQPFIQLLL